MRAIPVKICWCTKDVKYQQDHDKLYVKVMKAIHKAYAHKVSQSAQEDGNYKEWTLTTGDHQEYF